MRYERLLKSLIEKSTCHAYRIGAVLAKGSNVISVGFNHWGTRQIIERHRHIRPNNDTVHAEIHAILGVSKEEAAKCTLYVGRFTKEGRPANAKPCPLCQTILKEMGVKRVFYTDAEFEDYQVLIIR